MIAEEEKKNAEAEAEESGSPEETAPQEETGSQEQSGNGEEEPLELTSGITTTPVMILLTLMAYIAEAGGREIPVEQKAEFVSLMRKHIKKGDVSESEFHSMMKDAYDETLRMEFRTYLENVTPNLTIGQRYSVIANLYNMMMVDGAIRDGEESRIDLCRREFGLNPRVTRQIRRILLLKNDTSIFLDPSHPNNDDGYIFSPDY